MAFKNMVVDQLKVSMLIQPHVSWIKVVGMLPNLRTYPPHPELSQAGSLKQTHLVFIIVKPNLSLIITDIHYDKCSLQTNNN